MNIKTAIETGLAIIPLLDDEDFFVTKEQAKDLIMAKNAIINHNDEDDSDEETNDALRALQALKKAIKMCQK